MHRRDQERWLTGLAEDGDRWVTALFGYDRLPAAWSLDFQHGLPEHLVYLLVSGTAQGNVGERPVELRSGTVLWLPPRTPFRLYATGERAIRLYRFRLSPTDAFPPSGARFESVHLVENAWPLRETIDALVMELGGELEYRAERIRALLVVVFSGIFRLSGSTSGVPPLSEATRSQLEEFADQRIADRPSVADLAAVVSLSPDYFTRRFRATFGLSPRQWLVRHRIHQAMIRLEETECTVSAVAQQFGYPDVFLFSRQFKAIAGTSPRTWRRLRQPVQD